MLVMLLSFIFDLKHVYNFHEQDFGGYPILGKIPRQKMKFSKQERQRNKKMKKKTKQKTKTKKQIKKIHYYYTFNF